MRCWSSDLFPEPVEMSQPDGSEWIWGDFREERAGAERPESSEDVEERHRRAVEDAYERGRLDGLEEGGRSERQALSSAVRAAEAALAEVDEIRADVVATAEDNVLALALAVARHIVGRELRGDPQDFAELVRQALAAFPVDQAVRIRVHPEDLSRISTVSDQAGEVIPIAGSRDVRWVADPGMAVGGCVVDGPDRVLDGRVDRALERIYRALTDD